MAMRTTLRGMGKGIWAVGGDARGAVPFPGGVDGVAEGEYRPVPRLYMLGAEELH